MEEPYTLYLCEYYYNGELEINYFLGKDVIYNKDGETLTIFMDLSKNLIGGALLALDGFQYEMKRGSVTYDDIQERVDVNFNCSIWSFIGYDELAKNLIESGEVDDSNLEAVPDKILEYVRENYSKLIFGENGVRLLAID